VVNEGRATAKDVSISFEHQPGMKVELGGDGRPVSGSSDAATGQRRILLRLGAPSVIYPGMAMTFRNLSINSLSEYTAGQWIQLPCTLYCDGHPPTQLLIEGTLEPRRST
jgi:hypothetical protein